MDPIPGRPSIRDMQAKQVTETEDRCGPQPPKPNYYSPQSVRDAYYAWQECKANG